MAFIAQQSPCEIILEACATSNYWARQFSEFGHTVKLIHPLYARPYVKTNKNDATDAEALCEAASRPSMRFVHPKTPMQQDIQLLHRVRSRLVAQRTAVVNQTRGLLAEYGLIMPVGIGQLRKQLPLILEDAENDLSTTARQTFHLLYDELQDLDERVACTKTRFITPILFPPSIWFEVLVFKGVREFSGLDWMVLEGSWYRGSESNRHSREGTGF